MSDERFDITKTAYGIRVTEAAGDYPAGCCVYADPFEAPAKGDCVLIWPKDSDSPYLAEMASALPPEALAWDMEGDVSPVLMLRHLSERERMGSVDLAGIAHVHKVTGSDWASV